MVGARHDVVISVRWWPALAVCLAVGCSAPDRNGMPDFFSDRAQINAQAPDSTSMPPPGMASGPQLGPPAGMPPQGPVAPGGASPPGVAPASFAPAASPNSLLTNGPVTAVPEGIPAPTAAKPGETRVLQVQFDGLHPPNTYHLPHLQTRAGESYEPQFVEQDVKALMKTRKFVDVTPRIQEVPPGGVIVIYQIIERPLIRYIKMVGNQEVLTDDLISKTDLKVGDGMDPYSVKEARDKLEAWYLEKGFDHTHIAIIEGNKPGDQGLIFLVDEGRKQKWWWTNFRGNTIVDGPRLSTVVDSKPGPLWLFNSDVNRKKIDEDVDKLTTYYRGLGFLEAKVGRELEYNDKRDWVTLTFVINEGPRYKVNDIRVVGNRKIPSPELVKTLKLKGNGDYFNQGAMTADLNKLRDIYGSLGFVMADIQADLRYRDERAHVDLVYNIAEGARYRVGKISIHIQGDSTHTRDNTILNRLTIHPGDWMNTRKMRDDERRIKASSLFAVDPTKAPKITFTPLEDMEKADKAIADKPEKRRGGAGGSSFRGQAPDSDEDVRWCELVVTGELAEQPAEAKTDKTADKAADKSAARAPSGEGN